MNYNYKINLLKALAILVVVSGHLEFSLIPLFPPYSFQVMLFFFIVVGIGLLPLRLGVNVKFGLHPRVSLFWV